MPYAMFIAFNKQIFQFASIFSIENNVDVSYFARHPSIAHFYYFHHCIFVRTVLTTVFKIIFYNVSKSF